MFRHTAFFAWLLAFGAAAHAAPADTPANYAARWPLQLPGDASVVRLPLPAGVLTQVQTADLRDLRVFNASGLPVPLALDRFGPGALAVAAASAPISLPVLPILAEPQATTAPGGMALRIEDGPAGRTVRLDMPEPAASAPGAQTGGALAGALVDTREQKAALQAIELNAGWPAARPFTFRLDTSADLRQWQPLGGVTVYRGEDGAVTAPAHLDTHGASLQARYLRITWDAAAPGTVQLRQVRLLPAPAGPAAPERVAVPLTLPEDKTRDPRVLEWRLPFATPVAALDIRAVEPATLVPVRVLARQQREQPWTPLARHVVFSLAQNGQTQRSPALELGQAAWREWRMEAGPASPGFTAPPQITALLAPVQLVFVASGAPPFTLAAGRFDAADTRLPLASLLPGYEPGAQAKLPAATLAAASATPNAVPTTTPGHQRDLQQWTLWAVLLAGVLALGGMAWALLRQLNKTPAGSAD
ncbi:MAG: DUF3999 domain-containing protein [Burkholderiaceae bacterium]|nr:DUF3999 domain-containing protein [Burkholderiaceae bacterium]